MSTIRFEIVNWIESEDRDLRLRYTAAELKILIDDQVATRIFDSWSKTVTDRVRVPIYPLAEWLASNWWRLHSELAFEPGTKPSADWRLAHDLGSAGGGFVWPRLRFTPDDRSVQVTARALPNAPWEPVRYLNDIPATSVSIKDFDAAIEAVVNLVFSRLHDLQIDAEPLSTLWADVTAERNDTELAQWRAYEASPSYSAEVGFALADVAQGIELT